MHGGNGGFWRSDRGLRLLWGDTIWDIVALELVDVCVKAFERHWSNMAVKGIQASLVTNEVELARLRCQLAESEQEQHEKQIWDKHKKQILEILEQEQKDKFIDTVPTNHGLECRRRPDLEMGRDDDSVSCDMCDVCLRLGSLLHCTKRTTMSCILSIVDLVRRRAFVQVQVDRKFADVPTVVRRALFKLLLSELISDLMATVAKVSPEVMGWYHGTNGAPQNIQLMKILDSIVMVD